MIITSCVNLKQLNSYSSASLNAIKKFEEINYSFKQHCLNKCYSNALETFEIKKDTNSHCDCERYGQADSVTELIYCSIKGYFEGLTNLSNNDLTTYHPDAMKKSLTQGQIGDISLDSTQAKAYSTIAVILLKATTDLYRKQKLKEFIEAAYPSVNILLTKFQFILKNSLESELDWKKDDLYHYYKRMIDEKLLTDYEKGKATFDYYHQFSVVNSKQRQIDVFVKGIKKVAEGHQKIYEHINELSENDVKELLMQYASNIKDLVSEFNKIKE